MTNPPSSPWYLREFDGGVLHTCLSLGSVVAFVVALCLLIGGGP
jgi:hypothetical protein